MEVSAVDSGAAPAQSPSSARARLLLQQLARRLGFVAGDGSRAAEIEAVATLLIVALGLFMRLAGVAFGPTIGFWNDEANWAIRVVNDPLKDLLIRPIGFMLLTRWSVALLGKWEFAFRLLPWLAGLATPLIAVLLSRRFLLRPAARLLFVGIVSLSPIAIDFSKEFKPYGFSLMTHLLLPLLVLRWHQTRRMRDLVIAGGVAAPLAVFFGQDAIFLYPGLFLVLSLESLRSRNYRQLGATIGFAVLSAGIVLGMYELIWKRLPKNQSEYWGDKYGVFYRPKDPSDTALGWYAGKYADIAAYPGYRRRLYSSEVLPASAIAPLRRADELAWLGLHLAGLAVMVLQRRLREALLFLSPLLVCGVFNLLGYWPFGTFRTNVFLLAGMSAVAALGVDWKGMASRTWASLVPVALFVLLPMAVSDNRWGFTKQVGPSSRMSELIDQLLALPETQNIKKEPLFMEHHSYNVFRYYVSHHARSSEWKTAVHARFKGHYQRKPRDVYKAVRKLKPGRRAWILQGLEPPAELRPRRLLEVNGYMFFMVQAPPAKAAPAPAPAAPPTAAPPEPQPQ